MKDILIMATAAALGVAGCSASGASEAIDEREPPAITEARIAVLARLRDPESARFGEMTLNDQGIVCGSVNARNGFGGYGGSTAFWYDPGTGEAFFVRQGNWEDKGNDAYIFQGKGCTIGPDHERALEAREALRRSYDRVRAIGN